MKKLFVAAFVLLGVLSSCRQSRQKNNEAPSGFTHYINLDRAEEVEPQLISDFCNEVQTIILETTEKSLISTIEKAVCAIDRLYVLNRSMSVNSITSVFEFGMDGKFIKRIGSVGRGPGEYSDLSDFAVDEQNRLIYLLDRRTQRLLSYNLDDGKHLETRPLDQCTKIACVGELIYTNMVYRKFEESNSMLRSLSKSDLGDEQFYLPVNEHLRGWTDVSLANKSDFIFHHGNNYVLFSDKFSPEIYKLTEEGVSSHVYVDSEGFIDEQERQFLAVAWSRATPGNSPSAPESYHGIRYYFETERYIFFYVAGANVLTPFIYDKTNGTTLKCGFVKPDLIVNKDSTSAQDVCMPFCADSEGVFYLTMPDRLSRLRAVARDGELVDGLNRLEELKQLKDEANPVLFYVKFKK